MSRIVCSFVVVAALVLAVSANADQWKREVKVNGKPNVVVRSDDGSIRVVPGGPGRLSVTVETQGWKIGPHDVEVELTQTGNAIEIDVRKPRRIFEVYFTPRWIHTEVRVPSESDLDLHSGDGSISVESLKGSIVAITADGSITASGLVGDLHLRTADGRITGSRLDGRLVASTADGRIQIAGRFDALQLRTGDGSVMAEADKGSKMGDDWSLSTSDGSLSLSIPADLAADLDVHTGDGRIDVDMPVMVEGRFSRRTLRGTLNGGGPLLRLQSGDGSIHIERSR